MVMMIQGLAEVERERTGASLLRRVMRNDASRTAISSTTCGSNAVVEMLGNSSGERRSKCRKKKKRAATNGFTGARGRVAQGAPPIETRLMSAGRAEMIQKCRTKAKGERDACGDATAWLSLTFSEKPSEHVVRSASHRERCQRRFNGTSGSKVKTGAGPQNMHARRVAEFGKQRFIPSLCVRKHGAFTGRPWTRPPPPRRPPRRRSSGTPWTRSGSSCP